MRGSTDLNIAPMIYQLLLYFLEHPGELISREAIHDAVWDNKVIEFDQNLNFSIRRLRQVLGDDSRHPRFIETVPRRGYRFIMPVTSSSPARITPLQPAGTSGPHLTTVEVWGQAPEHRSTAARSRWFNTVALICGLLFASVLVLSVMFGQHQLRRDTPEIPPTIPLSADAEQANYLLARDDASEDQLIEAVRLLELAMDDPALTDPASRFEVQAALMEASYRLSYRDPVWKQALQAIRDSMAQQTHQSMRAHRTDALAALHFDLDLKRAETSMRQALRLDASDRTARHYMPLILAMRGQLEQSLAFIDASLAMDPGYTRVEAHAGWFYLIDRQWDKAIEHCEASLRLDPDWLMGHQCKAQAAVADSNRAVAQAAHEAMLEQFDLKPETGPGSDVGEISRSANAQLHQWLLEQQPDNAFQLARTAALMGDQMETELQMMKLVNARSFWLPYLLIFPEFRAHDQWVDRRVRPLITF